MRQRSPLGAGRLAHRGPRRRPSIRPALRRLAVLAAVAVLLGGCSLFGDDDDATPATVADTTTTTLPPTELLDAGAAPRRALRVELTAGSEASLALTVDLDVDQEVAGTRQAFDAPAVTEVVTLTVGSPTTDGATPVDLRFDAVTLDRTGTDLTDAEAAELTALLQPITGITGTATIDGRGRLTDLRYAYPPDLDPSVQATVDQFEEQLTTATPPLPEEPVGIGARWRTRTTTTLAGVTVEQESTYELTGIAGDTVSYSATVLQAAADQDVDLQGLPAGASARLLSVDLQGTTTGTFSLTSLAATAESELSGTQVIELTGTAADPGGAGPGAGSTDGSSSTSTTGAAPPPQQLTQRLRLAVTVAPAG